MYSLGRKDLCSSLKLWMSEDYKASAIVKVKPYSLYWEKTVSALKIYSSNQRLQLVRMKIYVKEEAWTGNDAQGLLC